MESLVRELSNSMRQNDGKQRVLFLGNELFVSATSKILLDNAKE